MKLNRSVCLKADGIAFLSRPKGSGLHLLRDATHLDAATTIIGGRMLCRCSKLDISNRTKHEARVRSGEAANTRKNVVPHLNSNAGRPSGLRRVPSGDFYLVDRTNSYRRQRACVTLYVLSTPQDELGGIATRAFVKVRRQILYAIVQLAQEARASSPTGLKIGGWLILTNLG